MLQQNITEEDEEVENVLWEKIKIPDLDLSKFIQSITIDSISWFESHSIPPPQKVNITDCKGVYWLYGLQVGSSKLSKYLWMEKEIGKGIMYTHCTLQ